jgi:SAM-dependent methyltransferase
MRMNSPIGKAILSLVREGNYAHPGEEEAIELVFASVSEDPSRLILDVGCGRGGTADYVRRHGWGRVTAVDIDNETLSFAAKEYPKVRFIREDVMKIGALWHSAFDLIYLFNSFYAFPDQDEALRQIGRTARQGATLLVFDYTDVEGAFRQWANSDQAFWAPIDLRGFSGRLEDTGWDLESTTDITARYRLWYRQFVARFQSKKSEIVGGFGEEWYDYAYTTYTDLLRLIENNVVGGVIIKARRAPDKSRIKRFNP